MNTDTADPAAHLAAAEVDAWNKYRGLKNADPVDRDRWRIIVAQIAEIRRLHGWPAGDAVD